VTNLYMKKL